MEVVLDKRYPLQVGVEQAWAVLADTRATAGAVRQPSAGAGMWTVFKAWLAGLFGRKA